MKKALSVLTACVMLLCAAVPAFASSEKIPLITVGGYASSQLYDYSGDEPQQVWPFDPQAALKQTASLNSSADRRNPSAMQSPTAA